MLLAYIDEIGEPGAFVARDDARFNTSPAFGYAGFVIPDGAARQFGAAFTEEKRTLFASELDGVDNPGQWERKGSHIFRPTTQRDYPQQLRVFNGLRSQSVQDLLHSDIFRSTRPLHPATSGHLLGEHVDPAVLRRIKAAAERDSAGEAPQ